MELFLVTVGPYMEIFINFWLLFMVKKYVLLERGFEKKKQIIYYIITLGIAILSVQMAPSLTQPVLVIMCGLNISLAREKHKVRGFFLVFLATAFINGILIPFLTVPLTFFFKDQLSINMYAFFFYGFCIALIICFGIKGKNWRRKFDEELNNRRLQKWETKLLVIVGVIIHIYGILLLAPFEFEVLGTEEGKEIYYQLVANRVWMSVVVVILTVVVIVMIMQGNKRDFYYGKALAAKDMEIEKERAEAANEAKSDFLSTMSHEIRTPMNAIVGMTDILLRDQQTPRNREYLNNIRSSGNALLSIINDILDFSKIESGKMEIVEDKYEPMSVFHDLAMIFHNRIADKKVELLYDIDPKMPHKLYGDSQRIRQVILNLMNNAIKFTEQGFVKLRVEVTELDAENVELCFQIQDSGQGIKEEDIDKLFGSFSQVDQVRNHNKEGSGLGLAISKQLVELMNGTISVESTYGKGSIFSFKMPQRIADVRVAAKLKTDKAKNSVVGIKLASDFARKEVINLAQSYGIKCVDLMRNPTEKTDFIIIETNKPLTETEYSELEKSGGKLFALTNPMKETVLIRNASILTKPLYSLNFCQLLNGEEFVVHTVEAERYNFTAPEAKILLVDDNEMNLKVATGLMDPFKLQIDVARNGKEAVQKILDNAYHMVLMDHMMPIMDGVEATKTIRNLQEDRYKELPIVALSANATAEAREMFIKEQMSDFVAKPIRMKEITECLLRWLPEELVRYEKTDILSVEDEAQRLPVIDGLNVEEGIKNCGSKELFYDLLNDFYKLIDSKSAKVEKCLKEEMIREYTIEVHALKSMARMIGALELSEQFYQMEMLGNAGEKEELKIRTPEILVRYRSYKELLKEHVKTENEEKTAVSFEQIEATLVRLREAIDGFDLDEADEAMKELENYDLPEDIKPMIEKLGVLVTDVAMEEVMALVDEIREKLM